MEHVSQAVIPAQHCTAYKNIRKINKLLKQTRLIAKSKGIHYFISFHLSPGTSTSLLPHIYQYTNVNRRRKEKPIS